MDRVERFDLFRFDAAPTMTQQGFMRLRANLTRTGVLEYKRADGSTQRELRHPDEVFHDDSLGSMRGMPLTDLHQAMVTPGNASGLIKGTVGDDVKQDGKFVRGRVTVMDGALIGMIQEGKRRELSPGYTCAVEMTAGEHDGERFDGIQRTIRYNHLAIGPAGWGRSGGDVAIKLDAAGAALCTWDGFGTSQLGLFVRDRVALKGLTPDQAAQETGIDRFKLDAIMGGFGSVPTASEFSALARLFDVSEKSLIALVPLDERGELPELLNARRDHKERTTMKITTTLNGIAFPVEVPDELAGNFQTAIAGTVKRADDAEAARDDVQGKLDAATADRDKVQAKLDAAVDPKALDAAVAERAQLHLDAAKILGADFKFDGLNVREIQEAAICKSRGDDAIKFDGKSDAYVAGSFEAAVAVHQDAAGDKGTAAAAARAAAAGIKPPVVRKDGEDDPFDAEAARGRMIKRNDSLWQDAAK